MHTLKIYIFLLLLSIPVVGQQKLVLTSLDSTKIKIGSQVNLILRTSVAEGTKVVFPKDKMFGQLEVLESYPVDTIENGDRYELVKKYGLTQFDSGRYIIPPLSVVINGKVHRTDPHTLEVANVAVDTTKQKMFDIKPVATAESDSNLWWYLLILTGFVLIGVVIYWDIKRRKVKEKPEIYISPIDRATGSLKKLDHEQLLQKGEAKQYYSTLTNIARTYIEEALEVPAMESTTDGTLQLVRTAAASRKMGLPEDVVLRLEQVLRNADMVKFAMVQPAVQQLSDDRAATAQIINTIHEAIPVATAEEVKASEAYKAEQVKKQQHRRRIAVMAACCTLVIGTMAYFGFMKIYGSLQENVLGYATEDLWNSEWIKSEYGNPAVTINTPGVLKRSDAAQQLPPEVLNGFQEIQMFDFGAQFGSMNITLATMKFAPGIQADINLAIEQSVKIWESRGATNITVNMEEFTTAARQKGVRAFGTLSYSQLGGKPGRFYYEIIYFQQLQGMQQILIMREDQDEFGIKIAEKIKKSILFKEVL